MKNRSKTALREQDEKYQILFDVNPCPMYVCEERTLEILAVNQAAIDHYGYSREEFLAMTVLDVRPAGEVSGLIAHLENEPKTQGAAAWKHRMKDSSVIDVEVNWHKLEFDGKPSYLVMANGITASKRESVKEALAQQVQRAALINRISQAVRRTLDVSEVFQTAVCELGAHLEVDRCSLFMKDERAGRVTNVAEYHVSGIAPAGLDFDLLQLRGLNAAMEKHGVLAFDDVAQDERVRDLYPAILAPSGVRSIIYVGVTLGEGLIGAFALSTIRELRHWTTADIEVAKAVADQTGIAIAQAELFEMVTRAKKEWESTFDAMSDGIFIFDRSGRLIRVNRAGAAMDHASPEALLGKQCCEILRTSSDGDACIVEQTLTSSGSVNLEILPMNLQRPLLVTVEPIADERGRIVGAVCTARDLSELRKVEAVARERQSLLQNILESAREAIYALDQEGNYKWCNQAMLDMTGYRLSEIIGHHFLERTFADDRSVRIECFAAALNGEPQSFESRYVAQDGSARYASVNYAPIIVDGQTTGVLGIAHDITEQKHERERAARADKLRALGQLASGVAHDFNNSLAAILGRAQLILRRAEDENLIRSLDIIITAAEDAAATVGRIQTFARKSLGAEQELLDASGLLRDAIEITRTRWQNEARAAGIRIEVTLSADEGCLVRGHASELREVFVNLIVNAVDAMTAGGSLKICCKRRDDQVRTRFADTGVGMEDEVCERIFEPFYTTKGAQGTGLGLAVSYGIIERHRGMISVDSEPGKGSTFHVHLPLAKNGDVSRDKKRTTVSTRSLSVLVIDDERFVRETLAEMLAVLDHKVTTASGGCEALEKMHRGRFDLVLTDLAMPEMDGWEIARAIRKHRPEVPVVLVTGYGATAQPPSGEPDLVAGIIGKPFDFEQVSVTIARVCNEQLARA
jgi:PAS domain S-box-containing protein